MGASASDLFKKLGKAKALDVLEALDEDDGKGFNQLKRDVETDSKTLARRIEELGEIGAIDKGDDSDYYLTAIGGDLLEIAEEAEQVALGTGADELAN